jgi:hypothetical protein
MSRNIGELLIRDVRTRDHSHFLYLLNKYPDQNLNHLETNEGPNQGMTALHYAVKNKSTEIIKLLLAHPKVDPNIKTTSIGETPFHLVCGFCEGIPATVFTLFLDDHRIRLNELSKNGFTPLVLLVKERNIDCIKMWMASGRPLDIGSPDSPDGYALRDEIQTTIEGFSQPRETFMEEWRAIKGLLASYRDHQKETINKVRKELDWHRKRAAPLYAAVVFVSDGFLEIIKTERDPDKAARFFSIARRLPLELQMVLCHRSVKSGGTIIPASVADPAFRDLVVNISEETGAFDGPVINRECQNK